MARKHNALDDARIGLQLISMLNPFAIFGHVRQIASDIQRDNWRFYIPITKSVRAGWSPDNIKGLLKRNGIEFTWEGTFVDECYFRVALADSQRAQKLLTDHGIPISPKGLR